MNELGLQNMLCVMLQSTYFLYNGCIVRICG